MRQVPSAPMRRVETLEARGVAAHDDGVQRARIARRGGERGDGPSVRAEHGEPQLARGAGDERGVGDGEPVARRGGGEPVGRAPTERRSRRGAARGSAARAALTSLPAVQARPKTRARAQAYAASRAAMPIAVTSVPTCPTAGPARSCSRFPLNTMGGYIAVRSAGGKGPAGHARRVIALSSLAVRPLATLVSRPRPDDADRPARRPRHLAAPRPARPPLARPGDHRGRGHPARARDAGRHRRARPSTCTDCPARAPTGPTSRACSRRGPPASPSTCPASGSPARPPTPDYTPAGHADALLCFLAGRGRPVHLLGNSLGGAIAIMVAARRPELVRSLTLVSPAMPDRRPDPRRVSDPRMLLASLPGPAGSARPRGARRDDQPRAHRAASCGCASATPRSPPSTGSSKRPPSSTPAAANPGRTRRSTAPRRRCCAAGGAASRCGRWRRGCGCRRWWSGATATASSRPALPPARPGRSAGGC